MGSNSASHSLFIRIKHLIFFLLFCAQCVRVQDPFIAKPYLQIGRTPSPETLQLLWHAPDTQAAWTVEYWTGKSGAWKKANTPAFVQVAVAGIEPHRVYNTALTGLTPGITFS